MLCNFKNVSISTALLNNFVLAYSYVQNNFLNVLCISMVSSIFFLFMCLAFLSWDRSRCFSLLLFKEPTLDFIDLLALFISAGIFFFLFFYQFFFFSFWGLTWQYLGTNPGFVAPSGALGTMPWNLIQPPLHADHGDQLSEPSCQPAAIIFIFSFIDFWIFFPFAVPLGI